MTQTHITAEMLWNIEDKQDLVVLYERMQRHLSEVCRACKRAFRDHKLQELSLRQREWILEPLYRVQLAEEVATQIHSLAALTAQERLQWAQDSPADLPQDQYQDMALGLLLEARRAPSAEQMGCWAEVAEAFLEHHPVAQPQGLLLRVLAGAYKAESFRRRGNFMAAKDEIRRATELARQGKVEDHTTTAEVHFILGKILMRRRRQWEAAEDNLNKAAILYGVQGDEAHRAQVLVFLACLQRRMELSGPGAGPWPGAVEMAVEAFGLIEPETHARMLVAILLEIAHAYCDQGQAHLAEEIRNLISRMAPRSRPSVRARYQWLLARLATAEGETDTARDRLKACSESIATPILESLDVLLALRDHPGRVAHGKV